MDCKGKINMIKLWAQELLGYQISVIQYKNKMAKDADDLNHLYELKISTHHKVTSIIRQEHKYLIPESYNHTKFHTFEAPQHIGKHTYYAIKTTVPPLIKKIYYSISSNL